MKQLVQLQSHVEEFRAAGLEVVALTYDAPELQEQFVAANGISYPMLSDLEAYTVKALGILNEDYQPGDGAYGIPYPGIFILNPAMEIRGKVFVEGYEKRVAAPAVLAYALEVLP